VPREPPGGDAAAYVLRGVGSLVWRYQARIRIHAPASVVAERSNPTSGQITPIDEATCEMVTGTDSLQDLATYLSKFDVPFAGGESSVDLRPLAHVIGRAATRGRRC
jgi:hypothetical protein